MVGSRTLNASVAKRSRRLLIVVTQELAESAPAATEVCSNGKPVGTESLRDLIIAVNDEVVMLDRRIHVTLMDLFPPTPRDPDGIHGAIWEELYGEPQPQSSDKRLTAVAYESADDEVRGYVEPLAVGQRLPDVAVFLQEEACVMVPLEKTYAAAWESVPRRWRDVIAAEA